MSKEFKEIRDQFAAIEAGQLASDEDLYRYWCLRVLLRIEGHLDSLSWATREMLKTRTGVGEANGAEQSASQAARSAARPAARR